MKEELTNEKLREADDKEIDIQELLFKYLTGFSDSKPSPFLSLSGLGL